MKVEIQTGHYYFKVLIDDLPHVVIDRKEFIGIASYTDCESLSVIEFITKTNTIKAEINGTEFILTKWCGYFMEGLPMGETSIKLTLLDEKGKQVESKYSFSERKITLKK